MNWTNEEQYKHQCNRVNKAELRLLELAVTHKKAIKEGCYTSAMELELLISMGELQLEANHLTVIQKRMTPNNSLPTGDTPS